jgi:3-oxoadipate CoA-transferase alpha subunit
VIDKVAASAAEALAGLRDGMTVMVGGFGNVGVAHGLIQAVVEHGARDLTIISNNAGRGKVGIAALILHHQVRRIICTYPMGVDNDAIRNAVASGEVEVEVCAQGSLVERIRAAGAGLGGVLTQAALGTDLAEGKPTYELDGRTYLVERPLHADVGLIGAWKGDRWGNLVYRYAQQNFNPVMAMAAAYAIAEVDEVVELGEIEPMHVHTPGIFIQRVVRGNLEREGAAPRQVDAEQLA